MFIWLHLFKGRGSVFRILFSTSSSSDQSASKINLATLLQFNATMIVGILIFLTFSQSVIIPVPTQMSQFFAQVFIATGLIIPFSLSSLLILYLNIMELQKTKVDKDRIIWWATFFSFVGVSSLISILLLLVFMQWASS